MRQVLSIYPTLWLVHAFSTAKGMIQEVKKRMKRKKRVSSRRLADELDISNGSAVRILKQDLRYRSYKKRVEPALTDFEKSKRMKFAC